MAEESQLFDQFPPVTLNDYLSRVKADLKGADFERKLIWETGEGFDLMPIYTREELDNLPLSESIPGKFPYARGNGKTVNSWYIRQNIEVRSFDEANKKALALLNRGVDSLGFIFVKDEDLSGDRLAQLLASIFPGSIELNFRTEGSSAGLPGSLSDCLGKLSLSRDSLRGSIESDPLGIAVITGKNEISLAEAMDQLATLLVDSLDLPRLRVIDINAAGYINSGATTVQELAFGMAAGSEYLAQLTARGIGADQVSRKTGFTFGTGSNYFMEIAKLRAARVLWAHIVKAYGGSEENATTNIHSVTAEWNKTIYDPYVNMLRTQTEVMSAVLGGADSVTAGAFDSTFRLPGDFSERIARNQQLILKEEAHFDKVVDPASGSYFVEKITAELIDKSWELFTSIEGRGGFMASMQEGFIQTLLSESATTKRKELARRKVKLLGTNIFPDPNEKAAGVIAMPAPMPGEAQAKRSGGYGRLSTGFERIRLATERAAKRPKVFILPLGDPARRAARAQFSADFFAAAGYEILTGSGYSDPEAGSGDAVKMKADIIVLCSSDEEYSNLAPRLFSLIEGRAHLVIAGEPPCMDELKGSGIEHFISTRSDMIEVLERFNALLGIKLEEK